MLSLSSSVSTDQQRQYEPKLYSEPCIDTLKDVLADRERLMEERKDDNNQWQGIPELYSDLKKDTEWELSMIYHAQKSMDYIIEEDN